MHTYSQRILMIGIFALCISALTGCGLVQQIPAKWVHPTKTESQIKADKLKCVSKVYPQYPVQMGKVALDDAKLLPPKLAYSECSQSQYSNRVYCDYHPAEGYRVKPANQADGDENELPRQVALSSCMLTTDYTYQCKRVGVVVDPYWCSK